MRVPYVGITDFTHPNEVERMLEVFRRHKAGRLNRNLMVGVMMSHKTLNNLPTKWANVFPRKETIAEIFILSDGVFNTLHYADYDGNDVLENLEKATQFGGQNLHALQLDIVWPTPSEIITYKQRHPSIKIVLQVNAKALEATNNNPSELVRRLVDYGGALDYILLDKSMGRGLGLDSEGLRPSVKAVSENFHDLGIAVAGGLGPDTLHLVEPLVKDFPNLSIDAQGKLRPSGNALDPIDWDMASVYLQRALEMFNYYRSNAAR